MRLAGGSGAAITLALAAGLVAAGCDWLGDRFETCQDAFVDLVNGDQSRQEIDLVADGEDPGPQTPLAPGETRRVTICLSKGDRRGFRVLHEGVVLAQAVCVASRSNYEGRAVQVRWGPGGLACSGW